MTAVETATLDPAERLLDVAEARFRRFGYKRTTVEDVAIEAGTAKGSVYLHFKSKQDIYLAVVERSLERFLAAAETALSTEGASPDLLRALVEATIDHYSHDELLRSSLFGDTDLVAGEVAQLASDLQRDRIRSLLRGVLTRGKAEGSVRDDIDVDAAASVLQESGWALVRTGLVSEDPAELETLLEAFNSIVGLGLIPRH
ncbi:MAG: TetR/AcrR family transcriptional regulator [Acidimicrobiia bacterium]|nr:TetR/AcrR family transcriptional regulator [Actinomycetota bacterium]MBL6925338.1 TetR/AcrR family transcriptional regulator [Acidimicrobiia bacterium]MBL6926002.1 TetR/AcrR family transcriptional regulator [Acidimicrobiia bacterium]